MVGSSGMSSPSRGWFAVRALLALSLLAGFYALAMAIAAALVWIPWAEWTYGNRLHPKLALACLAGAFVIAKATLFVPRPASSRRARSSPRRTSPRSSRPSARWRAA